MKGDNIFIAQQSIEDALYTHLQRLTVDELQRLSGKIWSDFNAHDPGVTIADIANYVLTELDYKLGFDLLDYLTDENEEFSPQKYGLYLPEEIYPTTPVTQDDYQKLLLSQFHSLKSVAFTRDKDDCYSIDVELFPFYESYTDSIKDQIHKCFHANRNLCENVNTISILPSPVLHLYAEIDIKPGNDATTLLAQIYWRIQKYLAGSIQIKQQNEQVYSDLPPDEWMEGSNTNNQRVVIPKQENTETELYGKLMEIRGIKTFKTAYLVSFDGGEKQIITSFKKDYGLYIPKSQSEFNVKIKIEGSEVVIEFERFIKEVQAMFFSQTSSSLNLRLNEHKSNGLSSLKSLPQGVYRDVYSHKNMAYDFPNHYGISETGVALSTLAKDKARAKQMKAYLTLFDLIIRRGLSELKGLKDLLTINDEDNRDIMQTIISQEEWDNAMMAISTEMSVGSDYSKIKDIDKLRDTTLLKNRYLDFLDKLYGIDSCPKWMNEYQYYGKTDDVYLESRVKFLQIVPSLTRNRSRAFNIHGGQNQDNLSTVKTYISTLLNMNMNESISVGNILPSHKLILMSDNKENETFRDVINYKLIKGALKLSQVESIIPNSAPKTEEEKYDNYEELRQYLHFSQDNLISEGLFRWGIQLENYKLIRLNKKEFILVFWNKEDSTWMNLGRSNNKEKLNKLANTLRRYLIDLNSQSEVMYMVEHNFFYPMSDAETTANNQKSIDYQFDAPFTITFVFSNWSARLKSPRFREICSQLIESLVPAHIKTNIYWLNISQMQRFESSYSDWRAGLGNSSPELEMIKFQQGIYDIFREIENEIQHLK